MRSHSTDRESGGFCEVATPEPRIGTIASIEAGLNEPAEWRAGCGVPRSAALHRAQLEHAQAEEIGIHDIQASRSPDDRYRTSPRKGLWTHQTGGFYHDGRFKTLDDVVEHYNSALLPSLSEAVRRLEVRLGVRLLNRTTRSVALTEAGARLLERLGPALSKVEAALDVVNGFRDPPAGTLRINVPVGAARLVLPTIVPPFLAAFPDIHLDVIAEDGFVDVLAVGCDAGVRS
jgi:hypothetical protein